MSIIVFDHIEREERELVALLSLSSWCLVIVVWLFLAVPWIYLLFMIVVFPDHTHLLFLIICLLNLNKSRLRLKNWRPISLLNVIYKIAP